MRYKFTLILLAFNLIAFGALYFLDKKEHAVEDASASGYILGNSLINVQEIAIEGKNLADPIFLKKANNNWHIETPVSWPANFYAVQRILNQLQFLKADARFPRSEIEKTGQTLADYGLDDPVMTLSVNNEIVREQISFGNTTSLANRLYLLNHSTDEVLVIDKDQFNTLLVDLEDLRNPEIFNIPVFELHALILKRSYPANLSIRISRKADGWYFESPIQAAANNALVNNAISKLTNLKVYQFINKNSINLEKFGLDQPQTRITLQGNHKNQTLLLGNLAFKNPKRYYAQLENTPTYFIVDAEALEELEDAQEDLRDKFFVKFDVAELNAVDIEQSGKKVQLKRLEDGNWQVMDHDKSGELIAKSADPAKIADLITSIQQLEAVNFISDMPTQEDLAHYGLTDPQRLIRLQTKEALTLLIGDMNPKTQKFYAKIENAPFVYEVDNFILSETPVSPLKYETRIIEKLPEVAEIKEIRLVNLKDGQTIYQGKPANAKQWDALLNNLPETRKLAVDTLLAGLHQFSVQTYLPYAFQSVIPLENEKSIPWSFKLEADVDLPSGEKSQTQKLEYFFTERLTGSMQIGGSPQTKRTFTLNQNWIDALFSFTDPVAYNNTNVTD
ncbi:MAG: hypothetical protein COZ46_03750 [Verrucomicrobia bacterium CG_4_10_14_3_um_filter_43_23]|nr:MAG: hypothetical protein AUJ82_02895 [Verrucomicrobia bacterium CG1_02_43_26]PIP59394.1 MAG: hypothetical protein COX01_03840 [Verrucomicrobia bacterium CG22_combo_CG10-13_8_21_14_all_43_17]PIX58482.1 MAG: hypothetical protein COZ46_03750 [Verrucomicrobia bacterium CG_4_10_14_3_um_filter_43_23]PIY62232.1 MAG: hypothetical protein COY94_02645 [Verrucomicrobia bacterium CG_4_10_14_0_8_um_filter_43_34]PJA44304.1 MAG: hypothetical protein CO175_03635 [Verrucomicrobia bacterium CG_4_9_14_3_um_fi